MPRTNPLRGRRDQDGFSLSFLDIMACGLGAVILVFLIIKHNTGHGYVESELLLGELETLERQEQNLRTEVERVARLNADEERLGDELARRQIAAEDAIEAIGPIPDPPDLIEEVDIGEQNYLIGLSVEGPRIALLLDRSMSMTHPMLIDVIRAKVGSEAERKSAPKWQRAKRALTWMLNRVPVGSDVAVIEFSETASLLGGQGWFRTDDQAALGAALGASEMLIPEGGTNLEKAFEQLNALRPAPTDVYLITDGLPTQANRPPRCARQPSVSGACRIRLFGNALGTLSGALQRAQFNVVLLPLEGDWDAGHAWWQFAARNSGLVISPAGDWP